MKIALIYFSQSDQTHALASQIKKGILETAPSCQLLTHRIQGCEIIEGRFQNPTLLNDIKFVDAIIFGSPTYMGSVSAQFKAFADASSGIWCEQQWADKIAAGFTCGSAYNGHQSETLSYMMTLANQHGMLWLGLDSAQGYNADNINRLGCQHGVTATPNDDGTPNVSDLKSATYLGHRVAKLCRQRH